MKKALVLSGGGGRGAYHVGVIRALIEQGWMADGQGPDIIAGTSIGAINAAALASGLTVAQLEQHWLAMHSEDVHRLSTDLPPLTRPVLRVLLHSVLTSAEHSGSHTPDLPPDEASQPARSLLDKMSTLFTARPFHSLLDTTPWRHTLAHWMDFERINSPHAPALLLTATDLQRGSLRVFCNRALPTQPAETLTLDHLMASSSIPAVYPWTEIDGCAYWDGAVLANTPLDAVIRLAGDEDVDILVVMMTPWIDHANTPDAPQCEKPTDLLQALTLALDWTLLASYRTAIKQLQQYNRLVEAVTHVNEVATRLGDDSMRLPPLPYRVISTPTVIAPRDFMPMRWIVDYEDSTHRQLFALGHADATRALHHRAAPPRP